MPGRSSSASARAAPLASLGSAAAAALFLLKIIWIRRPETAPALGALASCNCELDCANAILTPIKIGSLLRRRGGDEDLPMRGVGRQEFRNFGIPERLAVLLNRVSFRFSPHPCLLGFPENALFN